MKQNLNSERLAALLPMDLHKYRSCLTLPSYLNEALIGLILGDGHLSKSSPTSNTRLECSFKGDCLSYSLYIYALFVYYIKSKPNLLKTKLNTSKGEKFYDSIRLKTLSLPVFNSYHDLFYYRDCDKNK